MAYQYWLVFYANSSVLIPTQAKTTDGVGKVIEPMAVVDVQNTHGLRQVMLQVIGKGNPVIPHPSQEEMSKVGILHRKLGFKSHKTFNQKATIWHIGLGDGIYSIEFSKIATNGRGFDPDPTKEIIFPAGTPVDSVVDKLIEIIQKTHHEKLAETAAT